jgi:hypothetical protein
MSDKSNVPAEHPIDHQVRWFVTAVAVPVAAIALAATAYFGGQLPTQHEAMPGQPAAAASSATGR